ncbi:hypothetical protein C6558_13055 [Ensifer sp. NM-2]|uniref:helix-turn-helix domain-containing protein n=1 Tax=Ensifer sp. NM-2 TaxID=2109730 RepID=UPI000D136C42|nr:helix-turn-helix transcriptional regulator [Ensifer sp. NM-2]PSS64437.1 hypothetical protein C6558_13055 [Ensifer sp. NM-2]
MGRTTADAGKALSRQMGQRIRAIRMMRGYSQGKLGSLIGLSFQQVQKYENGTNHVSIPVLMQICEVLDAHPMDIIGEGPQDGQDRVNALLQRLEAAESKLKILESKLARMQKIFAEPD